MSNQDTRKKETMQNTVENDKKDDIRKYMVGDIQLEIEPSMEFKEFAQKEKRGKLAEEDYKCFQTPYKMKDDTEIADYDEATVPFITTIPIFIPEKNTIIPCVVKIQKEENWFVATDSETGIASQGKTLEKALLNIKQALDLYYQD